MKISVMSVMAPDYKLEDLVSIMKKIGYDSIEPAVGYKKALWDTNKEWHISETNIKEDLKYLKKLCDENGLTISSLATGVSMFDLNKVEKIFSAASEVGCPMSRVGVPIYDGKTRYKDIFEQALRNLEEIEKIARKYKVKAGLETHMRNIIPSASSAYRLVSRFDPEYIGVIYDPANGVIEGWENFGVDLLDKYIAHVHVKNLKWIPNVTNEVSYFTQNKWKWDWSSIPDGLAVWVQIIKALKEINFKGALSIEDFEGGYCKKPEGITTEEKLRRDFNDLQDILKSV